MSEVSLKRILLPIELGEPSSWDRALPVAVDLARKYGAHLDVLTVIPDFGLPLVGSFFPPDFEKKAELRAERELKEWLDEHVPEDVEAEGHVAVGTIYDRIIRVAEKLDCDLILMASHRPGMQDYLLGPNAARVVRHAPMSVFIVRS